MKNISFTIFLILNLLTTCQDASAPPPTPVIPEVITPRFTDRQDRGDVENTELTEASGLAVSHSNPDLIWAHNDSGDEARLFLLGKDGGDWGTFRLEGTTNRDWEDIALVKPAGADTAYIYLADIGNNQNNYDTLYIYRFPEPDLSQLSAPAQAVVPANRIERFAFRYPGQIYDAETLLVVGNSIYILTKTLLSTLIYYAPLPPTTGTVVTLQEVSTLALTFVVGGDVWESTGDILLKTYDRVYLWEPGSVSSSPGMLYELPAIRLPYTPEPQGESIAWEPDGSGYYTLSEKPGNEPPRLFFYQRN
ncbi:MAG: hypothetical protein HC880_07870 [Bacteroidia bacterium]|nr:hypothetical protein [Bacteroidia bacterium]